VMIADDGRVKILDFGLARLLEPITYSSEDSTLPTLQLTSDGVLVGTPNYMSPEQAQSHNVDARSDIFSFGLVLYELLTGRKAFTGDSAAAVISRIVNDDPVPPCRIAQSVSGDLERLVLRCLRKDPDRRHQTMGDLKVTLQELLEEPSIAVQAPVRRQQKKRERAQTVHVQRERWVWINEHGPSFSRDGRWIYFASFRTGRYEVWKVPVTGGDPIQITHTGGCAR